MSILEELQKEKLTREQRVKELQTTLTSLQSELAVMKITKQVNCPHCSSTLKITKYYIETENKRLMCPICGVYVGNGVKVEVIASPIIDELRRDIALLDKKIDELERAIRDVREAIDVAQRRVAL